MNASSSLPFPIPTTLSPAFETLGHETIRAAAFLLIPTELLYFSIYFLLKRQYGTYKKLSALSLVTFWLSSWINPISCAPIGALRNFAGMYKLYTFTWPLQINRKGIQKVLILSSCDRYPQTPGHICPASLTPAAQR